MIRTLMFFIFILAACGDSLFAEEIDLKDLTAQCRSAAKAYQPVTDNFPYKMIHTVAYDGWSGDSGTAELTYPIVMIMTFTGNKKEGSYWFKKNPQRQYLISMKSDSVGNCELTGTIEPDDNNISFHGIMKNGVIMGRWENSDGEKAFAFYVKARKCD